jgi:hypothetical protein
MTNGANPNGVAHPTIDAFNNRYYFDKIDLRDWMELTRVIGHLNRPNNLCVRHIPAIAARPPHHLDQSFHTMWLCTKIGFFSIVQKEPGMWHVRGWVRDDLVALADLCGLDAALIVDSPGGDYVCRLDIDRREVIAKIFEKLAGTIDYDNFKRVIGASRTQSRKLATYARLYHDMGRVREAAK